MTPPLQFQLAFWLSFAMIPLLWWKYGWECGLGAVWIWYWAMPAGYWQGVTRAQSDAAEYLAEAHRLVEENQREFQLAVGEVIRQQSLGIVPDYPVASKVN